MEDGMTWSRVSEEQENMSENVEEKKAWMGRSSRHKGMRRDVQAESVECFLG